MQEQEVTAAAQVAPFGPQAVQTLDYLADLFLHLQRKASEAYDAAYKVDAPLEQLKDKLIFLAGDLGSTEKDGSRILRGTQYEITLRFGESNFFDPARVCSFRYELIKNRIARGMLSDIFEGKITYTFRPAAERILERLKLSGELLQLYEECRSRTPILKVSPMSTTS